MSSSITPEALRQATRAFKQRIMRYVLEKRDQVDARTAALLQKNDLLRTAKPEGIPEATVAVLRDANHVSRVPVPPGPLVFQLETGGKPAALVLVVADFLLNPSIEVRRAALSHFQRLAEAPDPLLTQRTKDTIRSNTEALLSEDGFLWRTAALAMSDTIRDDWLCGLAGLKQCLVRRFDEGVEPHLRVVLRPEVTSVDSINFRVWDPASQQAILREIVQDCVDGSDTLGEALGKYYREGGHLPLGIAHGIAKVAEKWAELRDSRPREVWEEVWGWADEIPSPLPRYHACQIFVTRPQMVPEGAHTRLWEEVLEVVDLPRGEEGDLKWTQAWRLRCDLARHFCHHLASRLPGAERERIAICAWWMAEQLSLTFGTVSEYVRRVRESTVGREEELSNLVWQLAHPAAKPSGFYYATTHVPSVWSLSLLSVLGKNLAELKPEEITPEQCTRFSNAIKRNLICGFPLNPPDEGIAVYGYEATPLDTAETWCSRQVGDAKAFTEALVEVFRRLRDPGKLEGELRGFPKQNEASQLLLAGVLRGLAYAGKAPEREIWGCVQNEEWRRIALLEANEKVLEFMVGALVELQSQYWNKWASDLPHMLASACEEATSGTMKQDLLFAATILSSASTDTVSAVHHLLRGVRRHELRSHVDYWQEQLNGLRGVLPPWVAAKVRAIRAALHFL